MALITDYYRSVIEKEHAQRDWGRASTVYAPKVIGIMKKYGLTEILDYGAADGKLGRILQDNIPNVTVHHYEPGIPRWNTMPDPCDMVACIDVLEHVEPDCLESVLDDLERVITKHAFITIYTRPAKRVLNNGWNAHICLKNPTEWKHMFETRFDIIEIEMTEREVIMEISRKNKHADQ